MRNALVVTLVLALSACASGYVQFYRPVDGATPEAIAANRAAPPPATPIVERSQPGNPDQILDAYAARGFVMIGHSMFNSGRTESEDSAIYQGQKVSADLVLLLNPRYTGSVTSSVPITTPTTTTSYSTGTATAYGSRGPVTAYGSGTTTTYGSQTTYVPMTVHRVDYGAIYFVKQRYGLGVYTRDLNDSERQLLQSNRGAAVRIVVNDTPAFNADILVGDIITALDGELISSAQSFAEISRRKRGGLVAVSLIRQGKRLEKSIRFNP